MKEKLAAIMARQDDLSRAISTIRKTMLVGGKDGIPPPEDDLEQECMYCGDEWLRVWKALIVLEEESSSTASLVYSLMRQMGYDHEEIRVLEDQAHRELEEIKLPA